MGKIIELQPADEQPRWITIAEAARMTGYDERTVRRKIKLGLFRAVGRGRGLRVVYASILEHEQKEEAQHDQAA